MPVPSMPLTPLSRLCALFEEVAGDAIARAVGEGGCVFRTRGIIGDWTQKKTFWNNVYYGVDLSEGGRVISVDLPYEVIQSGDIRPGSLVDVIGTPSVHLKKSVVLFKLHIHAACVITPPASAAPRYEAGRSIAGTVNHLKEIGFRRIAFPKRVEGVSVIHSKSRSANVFADFSNELAGRNVRLEPLPVSMTDPAASTRTIEAATGNVIVLIRGGGDEGDFLTFQDESVVRALARKAAHRVTGLGHSANLTYADIVADFCTTTPASAGAYVREQLARTYGARQEEVQEAERQAVLIRDLKRSNLKLLLLAVALAGFIVYWGFIR